MHFFNNLTPELSVTLIDKCVTTTNQTTKVHSITKCTVAGMCVEGAIQMKGNTTHLVHNSTTRCSVLCYDSNALM